MTTDQEKSATPSVHLAALRVIAGNTDNWHGTKEALQGVAEYLEELELANIQLREELKVTDYLRETVHKQRDQIVELMKKLSVATEQLAIAQAREVQLRKYVEHRITCAKYAGAGMGSYLCTCGVDELSVEVDRTALDEEIRKALEQYKEDAEKYRQINTPEIHNFIVAVEREALHQRERWNAEHDAGKTDADWFWLIGYLAGKAIHKPEKQLHHIITTAAACLNWHAHKLGTFTGMRPGTANSLTPTSQQSTEPSE